MIKNLRVRMKLVLAFTLIAVILVGTGVMAVIFTHSIGNGGVEVGERLAPLVYAEKEIKLTATEANVLLKKILEGTSDKDIKEVWQLLEKSNKYSDAILKGGTVGNTTFLPSTDSRVLKKAGEVKKLLKDFTDAARKRYDLRTSTGIGSSADQEFDTLYDGLQTRLSTISSQLSDRYQSQLSNPRQNPGSRSFATIRTLGEIKYYLADGHLFFEEMMSGDESVKYEEIKKRLTDAKDRLRSISGSLRRQTYNSIQTDLDKFIASADQRHEANTKNKAAIKEADGKLESSYESFIQLAIEAEKVLHDSMADGLENMKNTEKNSRLVMIILVALGLFLAVLLAYLIGRSIAVPLNKCVEFADEMAEGNLTNSINLDQKDEIGRLTVALDKMAENTRGIIEKIKASSANLEHTTDEITTGSNDLASRTNQQAASLTETSTTVEEFAAILTANSSSSEEAQNTIETFNAEVQAKKELIADVTSTMDEIRDSGQRIGNFVSVINDISFQTNLLALNAAVEAARAGDAGRGFAVVAAEVRNLAQKTAESSKSIEEIISHNVESTEKGSELITQTSDFFETIVKTLGEMSTTVQHIASGSKEQSTGVEQINTAIIELEKVVNQNAQLVDTFAESSESLKSGADELIQLVGHFQTDAKEKPKDPAPKTSLSKTKTPAPPKSPTLKKEAPQRKTTPITPAMGNTGKPQPTANSGGGSGDDFFAMDEEGFEEF